MNNNMTNEEIYQVLEQEIVTLTIRPGDVLSENSLCKRFSVSRTPIRSILQRLQQNRFVQIVPHKGTMVTAINLDIASQWIYQRVAVESMVLRDFIRTCSPTDLEKVRFAFTQLKACADTMEDPEQIDINQFLFYDLNTHRIWFQATGKLFLWENLIRPQADYSRFIRLDIIGAKNVPDVLAEHAELIDIIENKRLDEIESFMTRHLYGGVRRLGGQLFSDAFKGYFLSGEEE